MSFLSLKSTKKNALIDFLSVLPEISTTACSKDNIKHGFVQAGIIDKEFNRYPVFNKILATCRQQPTIEEYKTVVESFADFLDIVNERGHLKCLGKFIPCLAFPRREGAYLYFDVNRGVFIRSGKVLRCGFQSRHDKHLAASKEEKSSSHFYFMYPSKEGKRKQKRDKLGCFKHLTQIIGAGFDPASEPAMQAIKLQPGWIVNYE
jgi:hypothetical protein